MPMNLLIVIIIGGLWLIPLYLMLAAKIWLGAALYIGFAVLLGRWTNSLTRAIGLTPPPAEPPSQVQRMAELRERQQARRPR